MGGGSYYIDGVSDPNSFIYFILPDAFKTLIVVLFMFVVCIVAVCYYLVGKGLSNKFWHVIDACWVFASVISFCLLAINIGFTSTQAQYDRLIDESQAAHMRVQSEIGRFRRLHCYKFKSYMGERVPEPNGKQKRLCSEADKKRDDESLVSDKINNRQLGDTFPIQEGRIALVYENREAGDEGISEDWNRVQESIYEYDGAASMHNNFSRIYWLFELRRNLWTFWLIIFPAFAALRLGRSINEIIGRRQSCVAVG